MLHTQNSSNVFSFKEYTMSCNTFPWFSIGGRVQLLDQMDLFFKTVLPACDLKRISPFLTCHSSLIKLYKAVKQIRIKKLIIGSLPIVILRDNPFIPCGKMTLRVIQAKGEICQSGCRVFCLWNNMSPTRLLTAQSPSPSW